MVGRLRNPGKAAARGNWLSGHRDDSVHLLREIRHHGKDKSGLSNTECIRDYYDARVEAEWRRLETSWLEYAVTRHFIAAYLQPVSTVLDIGGGPGRYALGLAAEGHNVDLADISPASIAFAEAQARNIGVRLRQTLVADARDLSVFPDASYDMVLCLGPLYHLIDADDRIRAVREALRVLKPSGCAFFAFVSRYAPIHFHLKTAPGDIDSRSDVMTGILEHGQHRPSREAPFFTEAFFIDPAEIRPFMAECGAEELMTFGAEGPMAQSEDRLAGLSATARQGWLELAVETASTPAALYGSEHIVYIGRKRT